MVRLNEYEAIDWFIGCRLNISDYRLDADAAMLNARGGLILISHGRGR
jgi:hypothetical protein